jgi:serine/threonine protein kinase
VLTEDRGPKITGFDFSCVYSEFECKKGFERAPSSSTSFIPPEQGMTNVRDIGPAKDICALGAIAYYLISWQSWSPQRSVWQVIEQARSGLLTRPLGLRPDLDPEVESVCLKCFENRPGMRYHSAEELSIALRAVLSKQTGLCGHS